MSSFKNIAIPSRNQPKKRGNEPAPVQHYVPATTAGVTARTAGANRTHRYVVGQRLSMAAGGRDISRGGAICSVVFLLPYEGGALRYRVRSDNENFERIVDEADLMPLRDEAE
jgi:hypothetical protein